MTPGPEDAFHNPGPSGSSTVVTATLIEDLVREHHGEIRGYLLRATGRASDADDLSQEVFLRAYRAAPSLVAVQDRRAWLFTVATNLWRKQLRTQQRRGRAYERVATAADAVDWRAGPEPVALGRELGSAIEAAVARLPFKQRGAFLQRKVHGLDYEDIGRSLGCSAESARAHVFQALRKIRAALDGHGLMSADGCRPARAAAAPPRKEFPQ